MAATSRPELQLTVFLTARETCAAALAKIEEIETRYGRAETRRAEVAKLQMEDASPYWHEEKYLYLVGRTIDGYRPRKYIGNNPERIEEALAALSNFKEYQAILAEMQYLRNKATAAQFLMQQLISTLSKSLP